MRFVVLVGMSALLTCCASPIQVAAAQDTHRLLMELVMACMKVSVKTLDDHRSDASTIAVGVLAECDFEIRTSIDFETKAMDFEDKQHFTQKVRPELLKIATAIVLRARVDKQQ